MQTTAGPQHDLELGGRVESSVPVDPFPTHAAPSPGDRVSDRVLAGRRRVIVGVNLASFALIFESSALTVAVPAIAREWRAPMGAMQWMAMRAR